MKHQYFLKSCLATLILWGLAYPSIAQVNIDSIRIWPAAERTRVVLDLSGSAAQSPRHSALVLQNPHRVAIDIKQARLKAVLDQVNLNDGPITEIRSGVRNGKDLRLVFDLSIAMRPKVFTLAADGASGERLVIDLMGKLNVPATVITTPGDMKLRDVIIAVDPGHGGKDPGAIGANGAKEKTVVLQIARKLARLIDAEPGFKARLTRNGDESMALAKRPKFAREVRADLFLSIHADAFDIRSAKGASVYRLSKAGNEDTYTKALADRENKADLMGGISDTAGDDDDVYGVLVDLAMTASQESSELIGKRILSEMKPVTEMHKKELQGANFAVLRSPHVPSVLIETGFISNPAEARRLSSSTYQSKLARAIFAGVKKHFYTMPPAGSLIAAKLEARENQVVKKAGITYIIRSGDTLSGIAQKHQVPLRNLKQHNGLKSDTIKVGQRLKIPG